MKYTGPPATIASLAENGVRQAEAWCLACHHRATVDLDRFKPETPFPAIRRRLVCSACGGREKVEWSPDWRGATASGRIVPG